MCPICIDPEQKFPLWLDSDSQKHPDVRPTFYFRAPTAREWNRGEEERDQLTAAGKSIMPAVYAFMGSLLLDWKNVVAKGQPVPFDPADLDAITDNQDCVELLEKLQLSIDDKKKSASAASSAAESCAASAARQNA